MRHSDIQEVAFTRFSMPSSVVSCVDFDTKGIYLACVTSNGSLSINDYEILYCCSMEGYKVEPVKPIVEISTRQRLEAVRWCPFNLDEVAYVGAQSNKVFFHDLTCVSNKPVEVFEAKYRSWPGHQSGRYGFLDLTYAKQKDSRIFASGVDGKVHMWDRRAGEASYGALSSYPAAGSLITLQLSRDEQLIYAGSEGGNIYAWDLRGGKVSTAFATPREVCFPPLAGIKLEHLFKKISLLQAQTSIVKSAVRSISLSPSCGQHLAFHLDNSWSGLLDLVSLEVTHIHCPPPPWEVHQTCILRKRPAWLSAHSVYAVSSDLGSYLNLLDFSPGPKSQYHVKYGSCEADLRSDVTRDQPPNLLQVSKPVSALACHPFNDHLVAGTEAGSLLLLVPNTKLAQGTAVG
ncbi:hypothetical protein O6H91_Y181700 [Diphasiastrum complanatum]|nr:hypothetical protein O6H91_Y181700 [Diphasiastrum complanatum]KAJ7299667.1 hypothetical protein O6H91_Y181700 [Diphasiastrum complanatum]KAJ7299668.1 hypothetical protein O6H91_Y181700 [Diphasiastrum complanatum]